MGWGTDFPLLHPPAGGRSLSASGASFLSTWVRHPGMLLCSDVVAPPASRPSPSSPVWAALSSLPARARWPRVGTGCLRELGCEPRPLPRPHPAGVTGLLPELEASPWEGILCWPATPRLYMSYLSFFLLRGL